jgi:low affinity Fe/Cu permease
MSTSSQIAANQSNAQRSTGPRSPQGKAIVALNNLRHGFYGAFRVLGWEDQEQFDILSVNLHGEHKPSTPTETALVDKMAQSLWLSKRAVFLQGVSFNVASPTCLDEKQLALYIRYQTTSDRAFHKCLDQLLKLRAEKRKQEIGFESQKRREEEDIRKEANEVRKQAMHEARVRAVNAKAADLELDTDIRETVECRLPGHTAFPFKMLKGVLKMSLEEVAADLLAKNPAEAA